jgi:mannosyltransferase
MATSAATVARRPRVAALARPALITPALLGVLAFVSVLIRTTQLDAGLWVDEGLSYGIADRPLADIPGVMRQDGSPPLYYMLLHVYTRILGVRSETALHTLSLFFAVLAIPVAYALARALLTPRAGWIAAVLVAANPFLTQYAQEARMYSLVVLLSLTTCATFVGAFVQARGRRWTVAFALSETMLLYTHNWGLFLGAGLALAFLLVARDQLKEGVVAAAIVLVLYAAWLPTLAFQVRHTGAPWANAPDFARLYEAPQQLLGLTGSYLLLIAGGAGLATLTWRAREARAATALAIVAATALLLPWLVSQVNPAWALRYLAVAVGPLLLLATVGLARAGRLGVAALAITALVWLATDAPSTKSNVHSVAAAVAPSLRPGDVVISTQPEQVPVLHYYLHDLPGLRFATLTGRVRDLGVTDWRDGTDRLERTSPADDLEPVLAATRPGTRVALVVPDFSILDRWKAPWSELVRARSLAWEDTMRRDPRFRVVTIEPPNPVARPNELRATVFLRR